MNGQSSTQRKTNSPGKPGRIKGNDMPDKEWAEKALLDFQRDEEETKAA
jgi:hypothetical protein